VVCRNKISSWITDDRNIELFHAVDDVGTEPVLVYQAVFIIGVVDAAINAAAHMPASRITKKISMAPDHRNDMTLVLTYSVNPPYIRGSIWEIV
jgi:hypothetical protein